MWLQSVTSSYSDTLINTRNNIIYVCVVSFINIQLLKVVVNKAQTTKVLLWQQVIGEVKVSILRLWEELFSHMAITFKMYCAIQKDKWRWALCAYIINSSHWKYSEQLKKRMFSHISKVFFLFIWRVDKYDEIENIDLSYRAALSSISQSTRDLCFYIYFFMYMEESFMYLKPSFYGIFLFTRIILRCAGASVLLVVLLSLYSTSDKNVRGVVEAHWGAIL